MHFSTLLKYEKSFDFDSIFWVRDHGHPTAMDICAGHADGAIPRPVPSSKGDSLAGAARVGGINGVGGEEGLSGPFRCSSSHSPQSDPVLSSPAS
jgi:hypothetical protein